MLLWLYRREGIERVGVSAAIWIAVAWVVIYASRPVTEWFSQSNGNSVAVSSSDEGNQIEAVVSLSLILTGLMVLLMRGVRLSVIIRNNGWLFVCYLFWFVSIVWSDYPIITFKRLFKDLGNVVMVLVVLTERDSVESIKAVCTRVAYLCIPLSVILIRYFPEWGRFYAGYSGNEVMWVGVATHKNTLGALAMVGALFLLWDLLGLQSANKRGNYVARAFVLAMCWYLLLIANSLTSLLCAILGSLLLIAFDNSVFRENIGRLEMCGIGVVILVIISNSVFDLNLQEEFLLGVGRDATLTTRTDIWPILASFQDNSIVGAGFNTFWAGTRLRLLHETVGGIIQAHNGYLETYLNGGAIGVALLVAVLLAGYRRTRKLLEKDRADGSIRYVILFIAIVYNFSEASFNKASILWPVTVFALMEYHKPSMSR